MPNLRHSQWRRDSKKPASGKPGAVHTLDGENAHVGFVTAANPLVAAARDANLSVRRKLQRSASAGASE